MMQGVYSTSPRQLSLEYERAQPMVRHDLRKRSSAQVGDFAFKLFIVLNGILLVRPNELFPSLDISHLYEAIILLCGAAWLYGAAMRPAPLRRILTPITVGVLIMLVMVPLSNLAHRQIYFAQISGTEFAKKVVYYVLLVGLLNSPQRLRRFLFWITLFIIALTALAMLQYHHAINIEALQAYQDHDSDNIDPTTGQPAVIERLCSAGLFNDPNDLCLILIFGGLLSMYWWHDAREDGKYRWRWLAPAALFLWALYDTHSRAGFMAMLSAAGVALVARFGWKRALLVYLLVLPVAALAFAGRQTDISTNAETAQDRILLWSTGLKLFASGPVFGIGAGRYESYAQLVAHNSFIQSFTELGFAGGSAFIGMFVYAIYSVRRLPRYLPYSPDASIERLQPILLGALFAYMMGYLTLSRAYVEPTYLILGITAAYLAMAARYVPRAVRPMSWRLLGWSFLISIAFLLCAHFFVMLEAHYT